MARHPHKLILLDKKTWRCALDGCSFFVHLGLAHILVGKMAICWKCDDQFKVDVGALRDEMPKCLGCREGGESQTIDSDIIEAKLVLAGKRVSEISPVQLNTMISLGIVKERAIKRLLELENESNEGDDEIEVIE